MEFRRFLKKGLIFASPLLLWVALVVVVDPFNYFNWSHIFPEQAKKGQCRLR